MPHTGMLSVLSCHTFQTVHERYKCTDPVPQNGLSRKSDPKRDITGLQSAQAHTHSHHDSDDAWPEIWIFLCLRLLHLEQLQICLPRRRAFMQRAGTFVRAADRNHNCL